MAERNIAALLRADARTIHVVFITELSVDPGTPEDSQIEADRLLVAEQRRQATLARMPPYDRTPSKSYAVSPSRKSYTYVTHLPVNVDDIVVVHARGQLAFAQVVKVDDEVMIEPGASTTYAWVVGVVDMAAHQANTSRNREIEQTVAEGMRNNMRRSFANQFTATLAPDAAAKLGSLIGDTLPIAAPSAPTDDLNG